MYIYLKQYAVYRHILPLFAKFVQYVHIFLQYNYFKYIVSSYSNRPTNVEKCSAVLFCVVWHYFVQILIKKILLQIYLVNSAYVSTHVFILHIYLVNSARDSTHVFILQIYLVNSARDSTLSHSRLGLLRGRSCTKTCD